MPKEVDILEYEDPSVKQLLNKTAKELHEKYNKQRKINERFLKKKTPTQKAFSIVFDVFCVLLLLVGVVVCFSTLNTTINGYMPSFAGYSNLIISSKSMVASGYEVGDIVIIHSVDTETLNVDDKIAFYVYPQSYINFDVNNTTDVSDNVSKTKYTLSFRQLFGFQSDEVNLATQANSNLVFHHIRAIYVDDQGERWFKTYGSSNGSDDGWWINENYVVGIEDDGIVAKSAIGLVNLAAKPQGIIILAIPALILLVVLVLAFLKNVQIAKLELDCVEEKRKITDEICVKNNVGFQMSAKTKFKILAQTTEENKDEYIKLLWKDGELPDGIKKYFMRKKLLLNTNKDLLELNRNCENMFKQGENPNRIAEHYLSEKRKIENRSEAIRKRIKSIDRHKKSKKDELQKDKKSSKLKNNKKN